MNLDNTLFILGAGSSVPYGYPTARKLRDDIISNYLEILRKTYRQLNGIDLNLRRTNEILNPLITQFDQSNTESIDLFLTRNKENVAYAEALKLLWIYMVWYEIDSKLNSYRVDIKENWYFEFYNQLTNNIHTKEDLTELYKTKTTFITFNYDRSLEHFLFSSFQNSFNLTEQETNQLIDKIFDFHHVYGCVLPLNWMRINGIKSNYATGETLVHIDHSYTNIKLIYSDRIQLPTEYQEKISNSKKIFFLGFGFASVNLEFLNIKNLLNNNHSIFATGIGILEKQKSQIIQSISHGAVGIRDHKIHIKQEMNNLQLLQAYLF